MDEENAHKRQFLQVFRRWEALFKRSDRGDIQAEKWLIADYYKSLAFLSADGLEVLTDELKRRCTFFPTIRECLEITQPGAYDYGNPFYKLRHVRAGDPQLLAHAKPAAALPDCREVKQISWKDDK